MIYKTNVPVIKVIYNYLIIVNFGKNFRIVNESKPLNRNPGWNEDHFGTIRLNGSIQPFGNFHPLKDWSSFSFEQAVNTEPRPTTTCSTTCGTSTSVTASLAAASLVVASGWPSTYFRKPMSSNPKIRFRWARWRGLVSKAVSAYSCWMYMLCVCLPATRTVVITVIARSPEFWLIAGAWLCSHKGPKAVRRAQLQWRTTG